MLVQDRINIPDEALVELCRRYYVRELALFGSVLRDDFRDESDIDVLVEFEPGAPIGFIALQRLRAELATMFGRSVDLVSKNGLNRYFREPIVASAQVVYER